MGERARVIGRMAATVTDEAGAVIGAAARWVRSDGTAVADPAEIAALEATMPKGTRAVGERVTFRVAADGDDERTATGEVRQDLGGGTYLVRLDDGRLVGTAGAAHAYHHGEGE